MAILRDTALIVALAVLAPLTAEAAKYKIVSASKAAMVVLDTDSVDARKPYSRAWVTVLFAEPIEGSSIIKNLEEVDCDEKRSRVIARASYDASGKLTPAPEPDKSWAYAVPGTTGAEMLGMTCNGSKDEQVIDLSDVEMLRYYRDAIRGGLVK